MYIHTCVYMYIHEYAYRCVCVYIYIYICIHRCIHTYIPCGPQGLFVQTPEAEKQTLRKQARQMSSMSPTPGLHHKISVFSDPDPGKS